ncbi:MAG: lipoate--protein ligase family protein [Thermaerobacter sp.]|nr:lipoate--protein ligase family protein [Thermaerobacter sp.]
MTLPRYRLVVLPPDAPPDHLRLSPVLAETVARTVADTGQPAILVRRQAPYVLLGPKDRRLPGLTDAVAWLNRLGFPVFMRIGGGSAVMLDEDCLSFAIARPCRDLTTWESNFRSMATGVIDGLGRLNISSRFGAALGSYCEGPFDLLHDSRKIAGIAQAIRGGFALVSGMLLVRQDPFRATALLQEFYRRAGSELQLRAEAVQALDRLPGQGGLTVVAVEGALLAGFSQHYDLNPQPLSALEWQTARALYQSRQLGGPLKEDPQIASHHSHR